MRDNLITALEPAACGIAVFPVAVRKLEDGTLEKKPVVRWRDEATALRAQIRTWWAAHPDCVIGIDLDRAGLFVVDLDKHPGAPDGIAAFRSLRGNNPIPVVPVTITATGGRHLFFRNTERLPNARGNLPAGIDVRGVGGFVVAPGSTWLSPDGSTYTWRPHPEHPRLVAMYPDVPPLPDWLLHVVRPPVQTNHKPIFSSVRNGGLRALCVRVLNSREGERNNVLFWASCRARDEGGSDFAQSMLLEAARRAGLPELEARRTINSAFARGL
jgi:Bifunctional DNA primase/polymerase, N-terminal